MGKFCKPFLGLKRPLFYITFCFAVFCFLYIFYMRKTITVQGVLERSIGYTKKITSFRRILPFKESPYYRIDPILEFTDVAAIEEHGTGTTNGKGFKLKNGKYRGFDFEHIPFLSTARFIYTLYDNCDWLKENIEDQFFWIIKKRTVYETEYTNTNNNIQDTIIFLPVICLITMEFLFVIIHTLNFSYTKV